MSAKTIPELHDEELLVIFRYLNYDDLLVLRKVNERFNDLVGYVLGRSVVWIKASEDCSSALKLFGSDDECVQVDRCLVGRSVTGFRLNPDAMVHIKKLIVPDPYLCNKLSTLDSLVHLEIGEQGSIKSSSSIFLKAPNLQVLNVSTSPALYFVLDCPKLAKLKTNNDLNYLTVMFPASIELLSGAGAYMDKIIQFTNLKKFVCGYLYSSGVSSSQILEKLTRLEEIHVFTNQSPTEANRLFNQLNNDRQSLNIFIKGINQQADPLLNADVNAISEALTDPNLEVYAGLLDFIKDDLPQTQLNIAALDSLNSKVLTKLTNLKSIQLTGVVTDRTKWTELLKASKIEELKLASSVGQDLLDLIPSCCGESLIKFELADFDNLKFCVQLRYLTTLKAGQLFDFELLPRLIRLPGIRLIELAKAYKMEFKDGRVKCYFNGSLVLEETTDIFKLHTVRLVKYWSDLFYV